MASSHNVELEATKFLHKIIQDSKDEPAKLATKLYVILQHMKSSGKEHSMPYQVISRAMEIVINLNGLDIEALKSSRLPLTGNTQTGDSTMQYTGKDAPNNLLSSIMPSPAISNEILLQPQPITSSLEAPKASVVLHSNISDLTLVPIHEASTSSFNALSPDLDDTLALVGLVDQELQYSGETSIPGVSTPTSSEKAQILFKKCDKLSLEDLLDPQLRQEVMDLCQDLLNHLVDPKPGTLTQLKNLTITLQATITRYGEVKNDLEIMDTVIRDIQESSNLLKDNITVQKAKIQKILSLDEKINYHQSQLILLQSERNDTQQEILELKAVAKPQKELLRKHLADDLGPSKRRLSLLRDMESNKIDWVALKKSLQLF